MIIWMTVNIGKENRMVIKEIEIKKLRELNKHENI